MNNNKIQLILIGQELLSAKCHLESATFGIQSETLKVKMMEAKKILGEVFEAINEAKHNAFENQDIWEFLEAYNKKLKENSNHE